MSTQNIISRASIYQDIKLYFFNSNSNEFQVHTYHDMVESIRHWKNFLVEQGHIGIGDKVALTLSLVDLRYVSLLYAITELGGITPILDTAPPGGTHKSRCRVLAPFKISFYHKDSSQSVTDVGLLYSKKQIDVDCWFDYTSTQNHKYADCIQASGDGIVIQSPTSGSTGDPKIVTYTHEWLTAIGEYCAQALGYSANDKILHLSNLHHGGSSGCFFFPTFKHCQEHYFLYGLTPGPETIFEIINLIVDKKINRVMFPNSVLLDSVLKNIPKLNHECHFYTLQANQRSWIAEVKRANVAGVISFFGATETLGPIFINTITPTSPDTHDVLNYGKLLGDFFSVQIKNNQLEVIDKTGRTNTLNDKFFVDDDGNYHYQSRSDLIRINEVTIEYSELQHILSEVFDNLSAALIADSVTNKIYLLINKTLQNGTTTSVKIDTINQNLQKLNPILKIDYVDFDNIEIFTSSIKLNRELVVEHFRKKYNLL